MLEKIIIIGNGNHAKQIADFIISQQLYNIVGFIDNNILSYRNINTIGDDSCLNELFQSGIKNAIIGVGAIANTSLREILFSKLKNLGFYLPSLFHSTAVIGYGVTFGEGNFIAPGVIINSRVKFGDNCILNTGSIIEHDVILGNHVHVAPRVTICGGANISNNCFIGVSSTVLENCNVSANSVIGAMSLVNKDIVKDFQTGFGIPFKIRNSYE